MRIPADDAVSVDLESGIVFEDDVSERPSDPDCGCGERVRRRRRGICPGWDGESQETNRAGLGRLLHRRYADLWYAESRCPGR